MSRRLVAVVGGQFGSEAKGHVTQQVIRRCVYENPGGMLVNVRVAGPNAGHTVYANKTKFAFRQLPVGVLEPRTFAVIAPGSEIHMGTLCDELQAVQEYHGGGGYESMSRILVDPEATILTEEHIEREKGSGIVGRIGSTGKGIGAARQDRLARVAQRLKDDPQAIGLIESYGATVAPLRHLTYAANTVVVEGTQGYGLGLHAGFYPQCTSSDCTAMDFFAMAGVSPWSFDETQVYVTCRVYPIRVAGNSGPLLDETTWAELGLPDEYTTVTKKVRRVGLWDEKLVKDAIRANGGPKHNVMLAITMLDQKFPKSQSARQGWELDRDAQDWLYNVSRATQTHVALATTSPTTGVWNP